MSDGELVQISAARREMERLIEHGNLPDLVDFQSQISAAVAAAKAVGISVERTNQLAEIKLRTQREAGARLVSLPRDKVAGPGRGKTISTGGNGFSPYKQALMDANASYRDANDWIDIWELPEDLFEDHIWRMMDSGRELTTKITVKLSVEYRRRGHREQREAEAAQAADAWPDWLIVGDFRTAGDVIPDNSVDLIFTDPPYDEDSARLYGDLAAFGARVLKPGGICLVYSGQMHLPQIYTGMGRWLEYMWTCGIGHSGATTLFRKWRIFNSWKPLLMYGNPPISAWWDVSFRDFVMGKQEKDVHPWQQAVNEAEHYVQSVCPRGGLVCDPFLGGGTSLVAAKRLGMRYVGIEIDPATAAVARQRIEDRA